MKFMKPSTMLEEFQLPLRTYKLPELTHPDEAFLSVMAKMAADMLLSFDLPEDIVLTIYEVDDSTIEKCWERALKDFEAENVRIGLRARLFAEHGGNNLKVKIEFLKIQSESLVQECIRTSRNSIKEQLEMAAKKKSEKLTEKSKKIQRPQSMLTEGKLSEIRQEADKILCKLFDRGHELIEQNISTNANSWVIRDTRTGQIHEISDLVELNRLFTTS